MTARQENVKWVDGLRGLASVLVVFTHIARGFDEDLFKPTSTEGAQPRILQYPILRVGVQGRIGVAIFSLVTGYVCALKPIRQFREGNQDAAFKGIAKSAFRRVPRLVLPTTIVTCLIWLLCQFGAFEVAKRANGWWLNEMSPSLTPYFGEAVKNLFHAVFSTWTIGFNPYDPNQWTLPPLLKGAMLVYVMLFATSFCKPRYRMMIELALFVFSYVSNDAAFGMQFFFGAFLSEISQSTSHTSWCKSHKWIERILAPILIVLGLLLASFPESEQQWMHWSGFMGRMSIYIFPAVNDTPRLYTGVGLDLIALGIHFSPTVKNFLSSKYLLWLGKNSFAVYLLHGTLLRTFLVWMYFGIATPADIINVDGTHEPGPPLQICGRARWYFWLPIWFIGLYIMANLWTKYVDPWCARVTERLVKYVFEEREERKDGSEAEKLLLPQ